jgi:putative addiction module component (TIGR02574 family)
MAKLGIDRMSPEERMRLVEEILESLGPKADTPLTEAQRHELDRRLGLLDAEPGAVSPWEEVEARLLARLRP